MSFSFEFTAATGEDAVELIKESRFHAPESVKAFVTEAVRHFVGQPVYVKAMGHLHTGTDFQMSNADIKVYPLAKYSKPAPVVETAPTAAPVQASNLH